ncbi:XAC2610-related protein [Flavobacterium pedocola]
MFTKSIFILTLLATITSCNKVRENTETSKIDSVKTKIDTTKTYQNSLTNNPVNDSEIQEINCDSVYKDKGISLKLIPLDTNKLHQPRYQFIFIVNRQQNAKKSEIYRDTIDSTVQEVRFADFNNDNVKDILIQNISDVRSNWTYNLYLVDKNSASIKKIKGFQEIKNPNYLPKYDLIDNMVMSGRNWTSFYKIVGDTIKDFNIVIYDGEDENGKVTYEADYKKAIKEILAKEKKGQ